MAPEDISHHKRYMDQALKIAFGRMGSTSPNPPVGAVIVKNGAVVSTGGTGPYGTSHAEAAAISAAGVDLKGADLYVSLEPCNHYGKTPPCTTAIIGSGIRRVFIPMVDPNHLVSGKGAHELERAGVEVIFLDELAGQAIDLIRQFKKFILRHRPFVASKSAITLDGRIAAKTGDSKWISSDYSRYLVHKLRAKADAVIVGKNTLKNDNPSLSVRLDAFDEKVKNYFRVNMPVMNGRDNFFLKSLFSEEIGVARGPLRVVVGIPDELDLASNVFSDGNYLFFEKKIAFDRLVISNRGLAKKLDATQLVLLDAGTEVEEAGAICDELYRRGIVFAVIEGGGRVAGSFLDAGELDQFFYFIAPKVAGNGIPCLSGAGVEQIGDALLLCDVSVMPLGDDIVYNGYSAPYYFKER
jgi:diaminohydroxyphosphoribosylaminopyrimidine deaminase / 5-amino-6-(5-phosphoribosylamino)uracil reductase